ncbi:MAG: SIMPL domain-containing protein, partial [Cyanobacteria bacterium]|nr:SIMPL domain-containing protein [Cyanobacteriota bacterium]
SLTASAEATESTMAQARSKTNEKMNRLISALRALNIENMKLQTLDVQVYPQYSDGSHSKLSRIIGYRAYNNLSIKVSMVKPENLSEVGARVLEAALNSGVDNVGSLTMCISDMSSARSKALELAVKDAVHNAEVMASAANTPLSDVMSLDGAPQYNNYSTPMQNMMVRGKSEPADMSIPLETGEVTVVSIVTAKFKI